MKDNKEAVNAVMDPIHDSANAIYEHLIDGEKVELIEECDRLIAQIEEIKEDQS